MTEHECTGLKIISKYITDLLVHLFFKCFGFGGTAFSESVRDIDQEKDDRQDNRKGVPEVVLIYILYVLVDHPGQLEQEHSKWYQDSVFPPVSRG